MGGGVEAQLGSTTPAATPTRAELVAVVLPDLPAPIATRIRAP